MVDFILDLQKNNSNSLKVKDTFLKDIYTIIGEILLCDDINTGLIAKILKELSEASPKLPKSLLCSQYYLYKFIFEKEQEYNSSVDKEHLYSKNLINIKIKIVKSISEIPDIIFDKNEDRHKSIINIVFLYYFSLLHFYQDEKTLLDDIKNSIKLLYNTSC